jgi:hypothetical protein
LTLCFLGFDGGAKDSIEPFFGDRDRVFGVALSLLDKLFDSALFASLAQS